MKSAVKILLSVGCMFSLIACGATSSNGKVASQTVQSEGERVPLSPRQADAADTGDQTSDKIDVVEKKSVEVAIVEKLRVEYLEMGFGEELATILAETRIEMVVPDKFEKVDAVENDFWKYDFGLTSKSGKVEVRFKILPGNNVGTAENGGNVSAANELMNVIIRLNGANLVADIQTHPGSEATSRFNADTYTTGTFQPVPEFSNKSIASAGLIYREGYGRIIAVTLMDNLEDPDVRTEWITGANAIRFSEMLAETASDR